MNRIILLATIIAYFLIVPIAADERNQIFVEKGNDAYINDNYRVALRFYTSAIKEGNENAIVLYRRAYCEEKVNDLGGAEKYYLHALKKLRVQNPEHKYFEHTKNKLLNNIDAKGAKLLFSCKYKLWEEANRYIDETVKLDYYYTDTKKTPLFFAIEYNNLEITKKLLKNGASIDIKAEWSIGDSNISKENTHYSLNPLGMAVINENEQITNILLEAGAKADTIIVYEDIERSALTFAIVNKNSEIAKALIEFGADTNHETYNPLYKAIRYEEDDTLKKLIEYGANINTIKILTDYHTVEGKKNIVNPITFSIIGKNNNALKILLDNGANAYIKREDKPTGNSLPYASPVFSAIPTQHEKALEILKEYKIDLERNTNGQDVLTHAVAYGTPKIVEYFLDENIEQKNTEEAFAFTPYYPMEKYNFNYKLNKNVTESMYSRTRYLYNPTKFEVAVIAGNLENIKYLDNKLDIFISDEIEYSYSSNTVSIKKIKAREAIENWIIIQIEKRLEKLRNEFTKQLPMSREFMGYSEEAKEKHEYYKAIINRYEKVINYIDEESR